MPKRPVTVFVVDDHELVREGLVRLLESCEAVLVVGDASSGTKAIESIPQLGVDVALVDLVLPDMSGIEVTRWLRKNHPRTEIIVVSAFKNEAYQREAFEAGARAFVAKEAAFEQLLDAIRSAARGDYYLSGDTGDEVIAEYARPWVARQKPGGVITAREKEIAILLADGYSSKEAAAILNISVRTAETHRASLMSKLGARNVTDVVKYCIRNRLISA